MQSWNQNETNVVTLDASSVAVNLPLITVKASPSRQFFVPDVTNEVNCVAVPFNRLNDNFCEDELMFTATITTFEPCLYAVTYSFVAGLRVE